MSFKTSRPYLALASHKHQLFLIASSICIAVISFTMIKSFVAYSVLGSIAAFLTLPYLPHFIFGLIKPNLTLRTYFLVNIFPTIVLTIVIGLILAYANFEDLKVATFDRGAMVFGLVFSFLPIYIVGQFYMFLGLVLSMFLISPLSSNIKDRLKNLKKAPTESV
jgi:hypothetical protein